METTIEMFLGCFLARKVKTSSWKVLFRLRTKHVLYLPLPSFSKHLIRFKSSNT